MRVLADVLRVRSGPGTDFRVLEELTEGAEVDVLETHGDWSWVNPGRGWVSREYLAAPALRTPPIGLSGIVKEFGQPAKPECSAGRVVFPAPLKLAWDKGSVVRAACHIKLEETFTCVFREVYRAGLWNLLTSFGGIYNPRTVTGSQKISTHAWGIAVDLNVATNKVGMKGDLSPKIIKIFEENGFGWGGRWSKPDPMHLQFAKDY